MKSMKRLGFLAMGGVLALSLAGTAKASTVQLTSGTSVNGWTVNFANGVNMFEDSGTSALTIELEKQAVFSADQGLVVTFIQNGAAAQNIEIVDLTLTNLTGTDWSGFQELLTSNVVGGTASAASFTTTFDPTDVSPFTTSQITSPTEIDFGGGILHNGTASELGPGPSVITIDANPSTDGGTQVINLKEIPIPASVPVPAAMWSGLAGLAMVVVAKKARRVMA